MIFGSNNNNYVFLFLNESTSTIRRIIIMFHWCHLSAFYRIDNWESIPDAKERKNIGGFRKGNNNNPEYRTVYFNPKDVFTLMKRKKDKRETGEGLVGNSIGEKVINTFNKKIYKWNGRTWLLAKFQN